MERAGVHAIICADADPHQSEYVPERFRTRSWISGFRGSAGVVVVTRDSAGLWTDSRYYLEAEDALSGTPIELFRDGTPGVPGYAEWTASRLNSGDVLAVDPDVISVSLYRSLEKVCHDNGLTLKTDLDIVSPQWENRPAMPPDAVFLHAEKFAGLSRAKKIASLRSAMSEHRIEVILVTALDDVAWLYNIRGTDVAYNPVATGYAAVTPSRALLFMASEKLPVDVRRTLEADGIELAGYGEIDTFLRALAASETVGLWAEKTSYRLYRSIPDGVRIVEDVSPITRMKARKNGTEQDHLRNIMIRDGVALERFIFWVEESVGKVKLTEIAVADKLREFRSEGENFMGESFGTIAGFGAHGAIVHYAASPRTDAEIFPNGLLLLDSGAQYLDGTTDITRVVCIGTPDRQAITDYTIVLKAHIALATVKFPRGTTGPQLDSVAREVMWRHGLSYGHGTGHGVGFFLNVHEGPQRFGAQAQPVPLEPGMFTSNEPGVYRPGKHGIRIENLVLVQDGTQTEFGEFYELETISLCHLEPELIDPSLLSGEELRWVNAYQTRVFDTLSPQLEPTIGAWLEGKTRPFLPK